MATAKQQRTRQKSRKVLVQLPNETSSEQESLVVVKRLLAISVSSITYLRGLFTESSYGTRYLDVTFFYQTQKQYNAKLLPSGIQGCFDALEKKYLRMAFLMFYTDPCDPESVTELYQFKFKYTKEGTKMNLSSNGANVDGVLKIEDLKEAGILLLRKLYILMQNLGPLPNDVTLTMKLYYYSDITPYNYQPPGFKEGLSPDSMIFQGNPVNLKIGSVSTGFHILKVKVTTDRERTASMGEKLVKRSSTEISHQGLDFDDDNEEEHCIMEVSASSRKGRLTIKSIEVIPSLSISVSSTVIIQRIAT